MSIKPGPSAPALTSRIHGCLLGGALGDSLGYAVGKDPMEEIRRRFGGRGLTGFDALPESRFSDETQLTLYTVDGLVEALEWANSGVGADVNACLWLAYLRWLASQGEEAGPSAPAPQPRWIDRQGVLRQRRNPDEACISGLATGEMGTSVRPVNPGSKGCGTVVRSAPFGLIPHIAPEAVYKLSADAASLTHGHPAARQSSGIFSLLIHRLVSGEGLLDAVTAVTAHARTLNEVAPELPERLEAALQLAGKGVVTPEELTATLGEGRLAEEALAVALYAVLATLPKTGTDVTADGGTDTLPVRHFREAVARAVNHGGSSDSTGSVAGNILGAFYGEDCLPADWLESLEAPEAVRGMANLLAGVTSAEG
ncbi:ADP-ribosylglycohydrolase family protein [Pseudarthrobacter sp. NamB4]|uniref:ADP-ribosylglycohydrolase family protein n=1 Tax=Pseudarthrobacter sp. NamB4 TaxID=2576837 RepID=UPI0010FE121F|nr:ADP-ribosylglycohydrolase family protein [Pseudarthrobacter sp. NamB4]TLM72502.1 ADP-ribosylglycohydrolase family protein [Pseudarthrobacter sp. NamB4]